MLSTSLLLAASMVVGQADGATAAEAEPAQPVPAKANDLEAIAGSQIRGR